MPSSGSDRSGYGDAHPIRSQHPRHHHRRVTKGVTSRAGRNDCDRGPEHRWCRHRAEQAPPAGMASSPTTRRWPPGAKASGRWTRRSGKQAVGGCGPAWLPAAHRRQPDHACPAGHAATQPTTPAVPSVAANAASPAGKSQGRSGQLPDRNVRNYLRATAHALDHSQGEDGRPGVASYFRPSQTPGTTTNSGGAWCWISHRSLHPRCQLNRTRRSRLVPCLDPVWPVETRPQSPR
jgi:hypothetical protein